MPNCQLHRNDRNAKIAKYIEMTEMPKCKIYRNDRNAKLPNI